MYAICTTRMSWDIHSYFEVRDGPGAPWRLVQRARQDEDGQWDVERDEQPFGSLRSSTFFATLTGIFSTRAPIDYGRLVPIVPALVAETLGIPEKSLAPTPEDRGPEFYLAYLNPIIFLRAADFEWSSPANMLIAADGQWVRPVPVDECRIAVAVYAVFRVMQRSAESQFPQVFPLYFRGVFILILAAWLWACVLGTKSSP